MSYPVLSCLITWTLMQLTLRPKVWSPCCRCAGMVLVAQNMLKVKIEWTWAPSLALQVCIQLVDGRHLCCYGRRQAMEPFQNIVIYLLRLVDGHFSSLFCFSQFVIVFWKVVKRHFLWGARTFAWDLSCGDRSCGRETSWNMGQLGGPGLSTTTLIPPILIWRVWCSMFSTEFRSSEVFRL